MSAVLLAVAAAGIAVSVALHPRFVGLLLAASLVMGAVLVRVL